MIRRILQNRWVEGAIILSMVIVVLVILFTPDYPLVKQLTTHAFEAVLAFLGSAMLFLLLKSTRIMFTCLGLCAILCIYLKSTSNSGIQLSFKGENDDREFSVFQVLIDEGSDKYEEITRKIIASNAEIINIQELTLDWAIVLNDGLRLLYPFHTELNRIDPYGMAIYSKFPITKIDTILYLDSLQINQIPALKLTIELPQKKYLQFIGAHLLPRLNTSDFTKVQGFMDQVSATINTYTDEHLIFCGDFNMAPWDYVIQNLSVKTRLQLSRREPHLFLQPFEHIFYSSGIECNSLDEILTNDRNHIGIQGYYKLIQKPADALLVPKKY